MSAEVSPSEPVDLARQPDFRIAGVTVRPAVREIADGATRETLEPRVMRVLVVLARQMGEVVSRDALLQACWDGRIVGDDAINVCLSKVRRAGEAHNAFQIETIPRVGYRMTPIQGSAKAVALRRVRWPAVAAAAAAAAVIALGAWFAAERLGRAPPVEDARVAVLPLKAISSDPDALAFASAADAQIAGALQEAGLQTTDRAGEAAFIVEGFARSSPEGLHVRVAIVEPRSDLAIWGTEFERPKQATASMANDIGWRVGTTIDIALEAMRKGGGDLDARTLAFYVQGRDAAGLVDMAPSAGIAAAVERSPKFALARGWRAQGMIPPATFMTPADFERQRARALAEAREALRLDPEVVVAYAAQAQAMDALRWAEREALLRRTLVDRPDPAQVFLIYFLSNVGRMDEAARLGRVLAGSHRTWPVAAAGADRAIHLAGARDEAITYLKRDLLIRPNDVMLQTALLEASAFGGDYAEADNILANPPRGPAGLGPGTIEAFRAFLAARRSGSAADREKAVATIMGASSARRLLRAHAIPMLNQLGAMDEAFQLADAYVRDPIPLRMGHSVTTNLFFAPETAPMRRDPRFIPLMRRLKLLDYWRVSGIWPDFCDNEPASVCSEMKRQAQR